MKSDILPALEDELRRTTPALHDLVIDRPALRVLLLRRPINLAPALLVVAHVTLHLFIGNVSFPIVYAHISTFTSLCQWENQKFFQQSP